MKPKKALSQHFLRNRQILERIVCYAELSKEDIVLEIGAGTGILTQALCESGAKVIAVEKDKMLVETYLNLLKKKNPNLEIIEGDAVEINLPECTKIVSNLPYNISSQITFKILEHRFERGILMYQREFAERMCAFPGNSSYGRLSVNVYYRAECEILEIVPRAAFYPIPKVESCVVRIIPRKQPPFEIINIEIFTTLVDISFQHRRKKMGTILKQYWKCCKNPWLDFLKEKGYYDRRPEELAPEDFGEIANYIASKNKVLN